MTSDEELTMVAASLAEFIDEHPVIEGRVAPKRMLDAPGARVMQLAFDAGVELKEHRAPAPILIQVVSGAVTVAASGQEIVLETGGLVHLAANVPHAVTAHGQSRIMLVLLRAE